MENLSAVEDFIPSKRSLYQKERENSLLNSKFRTSLSLSSLCAKASTNDVMQSLFPIKPNFKVNDILHKKKIFIWNNYISNTHIYLLYLR